MRDEISTLTVPGKEHTLFISARPGFASPSPSREIPGFIENIREIGVKTVTVLMPDYELFDDYGKNLLVEYRKAGLAVLHCPILDFSVPETITGPGGFGECIDALWNALSEGNVLVHCAAGMGRSGLAAACLLVRAGLTPDDAVTRVRRARSGTIQTREQEDFVHRFEKGLSE